jgi:hypothetical protein
LRFLPLSAKFWGWSHKFVVKQDQPELNPPYKIWRPSYRAEQLGQLDFIRANPEVEQVMYVDGYDTVFTGPPQELLPCKGQLWFGGDTVMHPDNPELEKFYYSPYNGFPYINCGVMWGDAKIMMELAADYLQNSPENMVNQQYYNWRVAFENGVRRNRLKVDFAGYTVLNIMLVQKRHFTMVQNRPVYIPTEARPLVMHAPGTGQTFGENAVPLPEELEKLYAA